MRKKNRALGCMALCAAMTAALLAGCGDGGSESQPQPQAQPQESSQTTENAKSEESAEAKGESSFQEEKITYYVHAGEAKDTQWILDEVNQRVKERCGVDMEFKLLSNDNYDLTLSAGENIDLIYGASWLGFVENAQNGAFAEISEEELKTYAPFVWENFGDVLNAGKIDGVCYGIPAKQDVTPNRCLMARGDLMEKYGIPDIDSLENIEKYLTAIAENEPDMVPFDLPGTDWYILLNMFLPDLKWGPIGTTGFGQPVYIHTEDPEHKVFIADEQPEMLAFTERMKEWNEKGFFSRSVLSNQTSSLDSFKNGTSALAYMGGPSDCQVAWDEMQKDDRASWDLRFVPLYQDHQMVNGYQQNLICISSFSKHKEAALRAINAMYEDPEVTRLFMYGIEGTHYRLDGEGNMEWVDADSKGWVNAGIINGDYEYPLRYTFQGAQKLIDRLESMKYVNPAINVIMSDESINTEKVAITEVLNQYMTPRCFGIIEGTPQEALDKELAELKKAGIDAFAEDRQMQLDAYMESIGK